MNLQQLVRMVAVLLLPGCGPSKEEQTINTYNRGTAHANQGEFDPAIADFTEAIRLDPKLAEVYYSRSLAYRYKGEQAKAEADFALAKQLGFSPE